MALPRPLTATAAETAPEDIGRAPTLGVAQARAVEPAPRRLVRGMKLGRYVVLEQLGAGGMGVVYAAYDPEIDRKVALKLLTRRPDVGERARKRLLREAQALGKLSHPNVVAVFDAGESGTDVFVAMELVDGVTLDDWLRAAPRTRAETLRVFAAAGAGLAAAHDAGIVHRDFKPSNVMVGADGRVRVLDFGLAREDADVSHSFDELDALVPSAARSSSRDALTHPGAVMGTPRYMSPEQRVAVPADERSDQYSFCVALWEALTGRLPRGPLTAPRAAVPGWLRDALARGLDPAPERRHRSMRDLLAALARDPAARRRRTIAGAALVALGLTAGAMSMTTGGPSPAATCQAAGNELEPAWNGAVATRMRARFIASERGHALATFERVRGHLDAYVAEWSRRRIGVCEASHVYRSQSAQLLDLRTHCLDRRRRALEGVVDVMIETADATVVDHAVQTALGLPDLAACSDTPALLDAYPLPRDPTTRASADALDARIDRVSALARAGQFRAALPEALAVVAGAEALDYPPVKARALFALGDVQANLGDAEAERTHTETIVAAAVARDDVIAARSWAWLLFIVGQHQNQPARALSLAPYALAAVARADNSEAAFWFQSSLAAVHTAADDPAAGLASAERALSLVDDLERPAPLLRSIALSNVGAVHDALGEPRTARRRYREALEVATDTLGADHGQVALIRVNMGEVSVALGDRVTAQRECAAGLDVLERTGGWQQDVARARACVAAAR